MSDVIYYSPTKQMNHNSWQFTGIPLSCQTRELEVICQLPLAIRWWIEEKNSSKRLNYESKIFNLWVLDI